MNCFNHTDQPAVAQCGNCGKFLCKECTSKRKPILCDECAEELMQQQQVEVQQEVAQKEYSENKLFTIGLVLAILNFVVYFLQMITGALPFSFGVFLFLIVGSVFYIGVPFAWVSLTNLRNSLSFILILPLVGWLFYFSIKLSLACIMSIYYTPKVLIKKFIKKG